MRLILINGPNLNLLGKREKSIYGFKSLASIESDLKKEADSYGIALECFQSNSEGDVVNRIHECLGSIEGILINAGAYTHTSIAIRDALLGVDIPYVELHLSNTYSREEFRQKSFLSDTAVGLVSGFGSYSYSLALQGLIFYLRDSK